MMEPSGIGNLPNTHFNQLVNNSFTEKFCLLSHGVSDELQRPEIKNLLNELQAAGCVIQENKRVYGCNGSNWPPIEVKSRVSINIGLAIGVPGGHGMSSLRLIDYLQEKKEELDIQLRNKQATAPILHECAAVKKSKNLVDRKAKQQQLINEKIIEEKVQTSFNKSILNSNQSNHSNQSNDSAKNQNTKLNYSNFNLQGGTDYSLDFMRGFGAFLGDPPAPANAFTVEDFFKSKLHIYKASENEEAKYIIIKGMKILAVSSELKPLLYPMARASECFLGKLMFKHGKNRVSDHPCKEQARLTTQLGNKDRLEELLPYLNGIPKYTSD